MAEGDNGEAQRIIDEFVKGMVAGRDVRMLSAGGRLPFARVQLDSEVTALTVQCGGKGMQTWPLESICAISVGTEAPEAEGPLDELCVTLASEDGDLASFRFGDMEERDTFALCLGMFVDNLRGAQGQDGEEGGEYEDEDGYEEEGQEFQEDIASAISAARRQEDGAAELTDAQRLVKAFVERMVRGRDLETLSTSGGCVECLVSLDRDLTELAIQRSHGQAGKKRVVPLRSIEHVAVGTDAEEHVDLPVDELCVALVLEGERALAFRLEDVEDRDTFALCLGIFVDGNRKKRRR